MQKQIVKEHSHPASYRDLPITYGPTEMEVWRDYVKDWDRDAVWVKLGSDVFIFPPDAALRFAKALRDHASYLADTEVLDERET